MKEKELITIDTELISFFPFSAMQSFLKTYENEARQLGKSPYIYALSKLIEETLVHLEMSEFSLQIANKYLKFLEETPEVQSYSRIVLSAAIVYLVTKDSTIELKDWRNSSEISNILNCSNKNMKRKARLIMIKLKEKHPDWIV